MSEAEEMEVNSDSEDSASSDGEEQALINRTEELEAQIAQNCYLYDAHEALISLYRKLGNLSGLREAFERFHKYFPLTAQIWLAYIEDEKKVATSDRDTKHILSLFERAVEDYVSVELWQEYAQYAIGACSLEAAREIVERGLRVAGRDTVKGGLLYDLLRELENVEFSRSEQGTEQWKQQGARVAEVFRRHLSVPMIGMESTYSEWQEWSKQFPEPFIEPKAVDWGYQIASKALKTSKPFEKRLQATQDQEELYKIYKKYISNLADPSAIICLYERAVTQLCLNPDIWLDYVYYALEFGDTGDKITTRALRNCPWSVDLWIARLWVLEKLKKESSEVMACFEEGISSTQLNLDLWIAYLDYSRRNVADRDKLYKLFDHAIENVGAEGDPTLKITRYYARVLAKDDKMPEVRELWKDILKIPENKTAASMWMEYAQLERQYSEPSKVRSVFERALTKVTDWPQCVADEWMAYEREVGTVDDVMKNTRKCKETLKKYAVQEYYVAPKRAAPPREGTSRGHKRRGVQHDSQDTEPKRMKAEEPSEKPKNKKPIIKDPTKTVFISNLFPSINEKRLTKVFPNAVNIQLVTDRSGKSRCYGYVEFDSEEAVMHALARDREPLDNRPIYISNCKPDKSERKSAFKYSEQIESNKLFVRGLPTSHSQEEVEAIFKPLGAKSVRLVHNKDGQSKGLAYVDFDTDEEAKTAIEKTDTMKIGENTVYAAISAPPRKSVHKSQSQSHHGPPPPMRHARSKLQLPMIPRSLQVKADKPKNDSEDKTATKSDDNANGNSSGATAQAKGKTNDDFRKMLLK